MQHREQPYIPAKYSLNRTISELFTYRVSLLELYQPHDRATVQDIPILYPDVSFYQGDIDFSVMSRKTKAVIIRAGQGVWEDREFRDNYANAKAYEMLRGIYWFYDDRRSPQEHFVTLTELLDHVGLPEMEIWIDWENTYGGQFGSLRDVVALMQLIEAKYPHKTVGMYTGYYWFVDHSNPVLNYFQYQYLKSKPLWLAWYVADFEYVKIPAPWTAMRVWQYGTPSIGFDMGVLSREIDMNMYVDTTVTFAELYQIDVTNPPTGEQSMSKYFRWTGNAANIRASYTAGSADKGDIVRDDVIQVDAPKVGGWFPFKIAQHPDGTFLRLSDNTPLDPNNTTTYWVTDAYFQEVSNLPVPISTPPPTDPPPTGKTIVKLLIENPTKVTAIYSDNTSQVL